MTSSTPAILPLTTVFVPPTFCVNHAEDVPLQTSSGTTVMYRHLGDFNNTACMPSGWSPSSYFSPGRCPTGYTVATSATSITNGSTTETSGYCCPTGYAYQESSYADGTPTPTERCYSTTSTNTPLSTVESMQWWNNGTVVDANAVSIRWHSEDFSTAPPGSHGGGEALSDTAWAGIGVGVTFGVFIAITLGMVIFLSRKKRNHQRVAKYISVQSSNDERLGGEFEKPLYFRNDPSLWSTWNAIGLDSWSYETIAVGFSVACFVAILCVLQIYNGRLTPQLPKGITLNTVVSILATASKSSLMFVVGECIAQLRWVSFRTSPKSLSQIQLYDSASRGPWGSLNILLKDKCRSLVAIGAFIVLLAMTFDPFMQQIIDYPVQPTQRQSKVAKATQSRYLLPPSSMTETLTDVIKTGIWADPIKPDVTCPTGNCTWPRFRSVEMCTKCIDVDLSNVTLSAWEPTSFSYNLNRSQDIEARLAVLDTTFLNLSFSVEPAWGRFSVEVPVYTYWLADTDSYGVEKPNPLPTQRGVDDLFGFYRPLAVVASAEFDLPEQFSTNQSNFQSNLISAMKIKKVTECALAICAREYEITVHNGESSIKILDEDFGKLYTTDDAFHGSCWKPDSSPMTNWSAGSWNTHRNMTSTASSLEMMDLANFEFCGVEAPEYFFGLTDLSGKMVQQYMMSKRLPPARNVSDEYVAVWKNESSFEIDDLPRDSDTALRVASLGLERIMANIASSVSELGRKMSNTPIYGVVTTQDSYVAVRWQWLTLPALLLVAGSLLLVATAMTSSRGGVRIWKSSTLPLLFHGMEPEFLTRNMMIEHGQCESASEMEQVADGIQVDFGLSNEGGRTMLRTRGAVQSSQHGVGLKRVVSRRRSF